LVVHFGASEVFAIAGIPVTSTVIYTWIIIAVLFAVIVLATRLTAPNRIQNALELAIEALVFFIQDTIPGRARTFLPVVGTLAVFILSANLSSLFPGMKAPTSDLSTTVALSLIVLGSVHYFGVTTKGLRGHLRRYFLPHWLFLPLNIIEELSRPLSLSLRLFGNILGEEVLIVILLSIVPLIIPVPVMALTILTGTIQAFIFTLLALTYIADATEEHH
jgi:F-type H+-transporting ATPase subunit a